MKLSGKVAIVTGGSRGIGKATAKMFVQEGAHVTITAKDPNRLEKTANDIGNVYSIPGDIRNDNDVSNVEKKTVDKFETSLSFLISPGMEYTFPISFAVFSSLFGSFAVIVTCAPSCTNIFAVAFPMPRLPPVTIATFPESFIKSEILCYF